MKDPEEKLRSLIAFRVDEDTYVDFKKIAEQKYRKTIPNLLRILVENEIRKEKGLPLIEY